MVQVHHAEQEWWLSNSGPNNKSIQDKWLVLTPCNCANVSAIQGGCMKLILFNFVACSSCYIVITEGLHLLLLSGLGYE